MTRSRMLCAAAMAVAMAVPAYAQNADLNLPDQMAWTAYDTGSSGYNQAVAIGAAMQNATGTNLRVLPGKNDVARMEPLRQGRVPFSAMGVGTYMVQEGVFEFGEERWGPQKVRLVLLNNSGDTGLAVGVAADAGVETYEDLKGKRVAFVKGAPALNVNVEAYLAYAGLGWDDVEVVEFGGYGDSWNGIINDQVDAGFAIMTSGQAFQAEAGPRGLMWPPVDPANEEGLARMQDIAPYYSPCTSVNGAVAKGVEGGIPSACYPYPILMTYDTVDADLVYNVTKAMDVLYPEYENDAPGVNGWAMKFQDFTWVVPYHEGAVRYFKEIGVWPEGADEHNQSLIERQEVLVKAWEELKAESPDNWTEAWDAKRRQALKDAGMKVVF